jgi:hypothetical protein
MAGTMTLHRAAAFALAELSQPHPAPSASRRKWLAVVDGSVTRFTSVPGPLRANSRARGPLGILHEEFRNIN